jgi:hypothetical protein
MHQQVGERLGHNGGVCRTARPEATRFGVGDGFGRIPGVGRRRPTPGFGRQRRCRSKRQEARDQRPEARVRERGLERRGGCRDGAEGVEGKIGSRFDPRQPGVGRGRPTPGFGRQRRCRSKRQEARGRERGLERRGGCRDGAEGVEGKIGSRFGPRQPGVGRGRPTPGFGRQRRCL